MQTFDIHAALLITLHPHTLPHCPLVQTPRVLPQNTREHPRSSSVPREARSSPPSPEPPAPAAAGCGASPEQHRRGAASRGRWAQAGREPSHPLLLGEGPRVCFLPRASPQKRGGEGPAAGRAQRRDPRAPPGDAAAEPGASSPGYKGHPRPFLPSYQASLKPFISTAAARRCPRPWLPAARSAAPRTWCGSPGRPAPPGRRRAPCTEPPAAGRGRLPAPGPPRGPLGAPPSGAGLPAPAAPRRAGPGRPSLLLLLLSMCGGCRPAPGLGGTGQKPPEGCLGLPRPPRGPRSRPRKGGHGVGVREGDARCCAPAWHPGVLCIAPKPWG